MTVKLQAAKRLTNKVTAATFKKLGPGIYHVKGSIQVEDINDYDGSSPDEVEEEHGETFDGWIVGHEKGGDAAYVLFKGTVEQIANAHTMHDLFLSLTKINLSGRRVKAGYDSVTAVYSKGEDDHIVIAMDNSK